VERWKSKISLRLDQVQIPGTVDSLYPRLDSELAIDIVDVRLDGTLGDGKPHGDLLVGQPLIDQHQHFYLATAEWFQ
jgi:hypothetical protein